MATTKRVSNRENEKCGQLNALRAERWQRMADKATSDIQREEYQNIAFFYSKRAAEYFAAQEGQDTFCFATSPFLPNGAQILKRYELSTGQWIVLAAWGKGKGREYITWFCEQDGSASLGNYFRDYDKAYSDFFSRVFRYVKQD